MARLALVAVCALAFAALTVPAGAQTYATLHVRSFSMSADRVTVAIGEAFHLTISAHVDESVPELDNLTLPDLSGFDSLGDERRCVATPAGTDCVETVTLAATMAGQRTIAGATLDAIDGRNGKASRFTTDPVSILVTGPVPAPIGDTPSNLTALFFSFAKSATIFMLVVVAVLALVWAFFSKRGVVVQAATVPAPVPPPADPRSRFRELIDALVREPTRFNALRLREAMRDAMHAREDETLADLDARAAGTPDDRVALRAVEKAAFCEDARVVDAVRGGDAISDSLKPGALLDALAETVVGQRSVLEALLYATIAGGHVVLEGPPGLAKTLACRALASAVGGTFKRIQFTPDLLPSDIVGTRVFDQRSGDFTTALGPIFANVLLADEINRAPAKVQSALLEGMQERQVTIGPNSFPLPDPFLVTATMNPLDSDGTYALPLAQMDRFLMKIVVAYPTVEEELSILERFGGAPPPMPADVASMPDLLRWRDEARAVFVEPRIARYIVALVQATRNPHEYVERGASPRATLALAAIARARALCAGRTFVLPDDVRASAPPVLRHRVAFNYRTLTENVDTENVIAAIVAGVVVP